MSKTILIVDDSSTIRKHLRAVLEGAGHTCLEAEDGTQGLDRVAQHPEIDLVISDVHMPRMNGIDMARNITTHARPHTLPILILTTESNPESIQQARAAGVSGWMVKPCKPPHILQAIERLVG